jgi:hypothetical protein
MLVASRSSNSAKLSRSPSRPASYGGSQVTLKDVPLPLDEWLVSPP